MDTLEDTLEAIESLRSQMIASAEKHGLSHEKCIALSKELDCLLNTYEKKKRGVT